MYGKTLYPSMTILCGLTGAWSYNQEICFICFLCMPANKYEEQETEAEIQLTEECWINPQKSQKWRQKTQKIER